jgi:hypothetical protein
VSDYARHLRRNLVDWHGFQSFSMHGSPTPSVKDYDVNAQVEWVTFTIWLFRILARYRSVGPRHGTLAVNFAHDAGFWQAELRVHPAHNCTQGHWCTGNLQVELHLAGA